MGKTWAFKNGLLHAREEQIEVMLQQVFQKTRRYGRTQIGLSVLAPAARELPNRLGLSLNELTDSNDRLPPRIALALGRSPAGENTFRAGDRSLDSKFGRHETDVSMAGADDRLSDHQDRRGPGPVCLVSSLAVRPARSPSWA